MSDHDELVKQARRLAAKLSPDEKSDMSFEWSYVANHELRMVINTVRQLKWLIVGIGAPILIATVVNFIKG